MLANKFTRSNLMFIFLWKSIAASTSKIKNTYYGTWCLQNQCADSGKSRCIRWLWLSWGQKYSLHVEPGYMLENIDVVTNAILWGRYIWL